jgi:hypothetical protein
MVSETEMVDLGCSVAQPIGFESRTFFQLAVKQKR